MSTVFPEFSGPQRLLIAGFLRGYRAWRLPSPPPVGSNRLMSTSVTQHLWRPGRNVATCENLIYATRALDILSNRSTDYSICGCAVCKTGGGWLNDREGPKNMLIERIEALRGHETPSTNPACSECGFYALHLHGWLGDKVVKQYLAGPINAYGSIKATGHVVLGTKGFRAQYAEIEALAGGDDVREVAEVYNVPWFPSLNDLAEEFPVTPVDGVDYGIGHWQYHFAGPGSRTAP